MLPEHGCSLAPLGVFEAPPAQLANGLARTIEETTSLPAACLIIKYSAKPTQTVSVMGVASRAGRCRTKKKLPRPRRGRAGVLVLSSFRKRLNFGLEAKLSELSDQALGFLFNWAAIEIATPEISMFDAVL